MRTIIRAGLIALAVLVNVWAFSPSAAKAMPVFGDCADDREMCICETSQYRCLGYFQDNCDSDADCKPTQT